MAKKSESCGLNGTSRVDIFRHVAVDELSNRVDSQILELIAREEYNNFVRFCEQVTAEKDNIHDVSCSMTNGKLEFAINYKSNQ